MHDSVEHTARRNARRAKESARILALTPDSDNIAPTRHDAMRIARAMSDDCAKYDRRVSRALILASIKRGV